MASVTCSVRVGLASVDPGLGPEAGAFRCDLSHPDLLDSPALHAHPAASRHT